MTASPPKICYILEVKTVKCLWEVFTISISITIIRLTVKVLRADWQRDWQHDFCHAQGWPVHCHRADRVVIPASSFVVVNFQLRHSIQFHSSREWPVFTTTTSLQPTASFIACYVSTSSRGCCRLIDTVLFSTAPSTGFLVFTTSRRMY